MVTFKAHFFHFKKKLCSEQLFYNYSTHTSHHGSYLNAPPQAAFFKFLKKQKQLCRELSQESDYVLCSRGEATTIWQLKHWAVCVARAADSKLTQTSSEICDGSH